MPPTKKPTPTEQCLICKKPATGRQGEIYEGKGSNGMILKFFLCDQDAEPLLKATAAAKQ